MALNADDLLARVRDWCRRRAEFFEPQYVERAPRLERWKRTGWQFVSTMLGFLIAGWLSYLIFVAGSWQPTEFLASAVILSLLVVALAIGDWLFRWGFDRWDLVEPWPFREERVKMEMQTECDSE